MATATFNAGIDYFGLASATNNKIKVTGSNENRSIQSASGQNCYGDTIAVDAWGETSAPSSEYQVVDSISHTLASPIIRLGDVIAAGSSQIKIGSVSVPIAVGSLSISTQTGSAPTINVSGQALFTGATKLRDYPLPAFALSPRHRAQDFLSLCTIRLDKNQTTNPVAVPSTDYGLASVNATFPIEFTLGQPKGNLLTYDLHGGTATVDYTMNWYAEFPPTIAAAGSITLLNAEMDTSTVAPTDLKTMACPVTMTNPVAKSCPEGGYTQYTWQCSFPLVGSEGANPTYTESQSSS